MKIYFDDGYQCPDANQPGLKKEIDRYLNTVGMINLIPEDLYEAKLILNNAQKRLEKLNSKFKKNRPIVQRALLTSTLKQFAEVIEDFGSKENKEFIRGIYIGLRLMGILDSSWKIIP